jgi:5-(carboxyamino)imidazole ribonucleotide synthase
VLHVTQHRLREKSFLKQNGFPVAPFRPVNSLDQLRSAVEQIGCPAIMKTAVSGYDGKGQVTLANPADAEAAFAATGSQEKILEAFIDFELEFSIVAARGQDGSFSHWGLIENTHCNHILDLSLAPARVPQATSVQALEIARNLLEMLDVVGVLCIEFFLSRDQRVFINELAPRPHNSGHLTINAALTSQFEQQLRAVCGLPLGATNFLTPAAMANLLGDLWQDGEPNWAVAAACPDVKLHLYGKDQVRPGRKMGHLTALAPSPDAAVERVIHARNLLSDR